MATADAGFMELIRAIVADDINASSALIATSPRLATMRAGSGATRRTAAENYIEDIEHYLYAGDGALHIAAAAHRPALIRLLVAAGADVGARNRRGAEPLHYAADGSPGSPIWDPVAQAEAITCLLEAGAEPDAADKSGVTPLHRAVRTRCAAAVRALIEGGADADLTNGRGATPLQLATRTSGRGGSGSPAAKAQQKQIIDVLRRAGATW